MADILVIHSGKQYLLLTANVAPQPNGEPLKPIGDFTPAFLIRKGRMYSFDEGENCSGQHR